MRSCFIILFILIVCSPLVAQVAKNSYHVPNNSDITRTIPFKDRYLLENFRKGLVYFRNGSKSEARLNYSFFHAEIQFIDEKKDTLLLAESEFVSKVTIDDLLFYYLPKQGYIQQIGDFNKVRLGRRQKLIMADTEHRTAYGGYSSTASVNSLTTYVDRQGQQQKLNAGTNVIMRNAATYFFMDQNQRFYSASKANLSKIFPKHKDEISQYFKEHDVNFLIEQDMVSLLEYCKAF